MRVMAGGHIVVLWLLLWYCLGRPVITWYYVLGRFPLEEAVVNGGDNRCAYDSPTGISLLSERE